MAGLWCLCQRFELQARLAKLYEDGWRPLYTIPIPSSQLYQYHNPPSMISNADGTTTISFRIATSPTMSTGEPAYETYLARYVGPPSPQIDADNITQRIA